MAIGDSGIRTWVGFLPLALFGMFLRAGQPAPDFLRAEILISPDPLAESVSGEVRYEVSSEGMLDSIRLDAHNMEFSRVELNGAPVAYSAVNGKLAIPAPGQEGIHKIFIAYRAFPRQALYFFGWKDSIAGNEQIWTQGQGKNNSHWVPVVDRMEEKMEFDLSVRFDSAYQVISNGRLVQKSSQGSDSRWDFDMENPMSSYLLAFAVGPFDHLEQQSRSGVPIQLFYPRGAVEKARWTYLHSSEIFDFMEREIGVPYPWGDYKQVPVADFMYAGMENTGSTFFSDRYLVDSLGYNDQNYINVNAHELAHQWFGNLVTETEPSEHWLHEGFATYFAYRAEMELPGEGDIYWRLFDTAGVLSAMDAKGEGESLLDPGSGSLTFYEKGAWALFALHAQVGDTAFGKGIRSFLETYAFGNATVSDFIAVMEASYGASLSGFRQKWLESTSFPMEDAMAFLSARSDEVRDFLELQAAVRDAPEQEELLVSEAWIPATGTAYREHLLRQYRSAFSRPLLDTLFLEGPLPLWKALLETTPIFEEWRFPAMEAWLDVPSYDLREGALLRLWVADPAGRARYLDRVAENGSLADPELQQLWWLLAVITDSYGTPEEKKAYLDRLRETTSPAFPWEIRENGISLLHEVGGFNSQNINDIVEATEHHSWQFRKFARTIFEAVLNEPSGREAITRSVKTFPRDRYPYAYQQIENP